RRRVARRRQRLIWIFHLAASLLLKIFTRGRRRLAGLRAALFDWRSDARARDFSQQAHLVVPPAAPRHRALPEVSVGRVEDDAVLAFGFQRGGLRLAEDAIPAIYQLMHVWIDWIGRRHHKNARAVAAHLVFVQPD